MILMMKMRVQILVVVKIPTMEQNDTFDKTRIVYLLYLIYFKI